MGTTVCVGGLNSVGKTTLLGKLSHYCDAHDISCKLMLEMYTDSVRWMVKKNLAVEDAFMFAHRLQMAVDAPLLARQYDLVLMERGFIDHLAFIEAFNACGLLDDYLVDWARNVVEEVAPPKPERYIFLEVSPEVALERKRGRGSSGTGVFNLEFLSELREAYLRLIPLYDSNPLVLDWSDFGKELSMDRLLDQIVSQDVAKL